MKSSDRAASTDEQELYRLYNELIASWNRRDAPAFASLYSEDASAVGFDGTRMEGRSEIEWTIRGFFAEPTGTYVSKIRGVPLLTRDVAVLHAVVGRIPPGQSDLNPALNAIQSLVASKQAGRWVIDLFQNTPAVFSGRPDLSQQLTEELRDVLRRRGLTRA